MIVDSSAVVAILKEEPEAPQIAEAMENAVMPLCMSAANFLEAAIVIDARRDAVASRRLDELIERARIVIEPVTAEQARIARQAYRDFGKGSGHKASLNFGDCFAYALSADKRQPLLFKGDDFRYAGVRSALA